MLVCALVAGCESSKPSGPPTVNLSLTAPTDGVTVDTNAIEVIGKVTPSVAEVTIAGHRVKVSHGTFKRPMTLTRPLNRIRVSARAKGFATSSMLVSIRYAAPKHVVHHAGHQTRPESIVETNFVSSCSDSPAGSTRTCTCLWNRLSAAGLASDRALESLAADWRRTFAATGTITYPAPFKDAILSCVKQSG